MPALLFIFSFVLVIFFLLLDFFVLLFFQIAAVSISRNVRMKTCVATIRGLGRVLNPKAGGPG